MDEETIKDDLDEELEAILQELISIKSGGESSEEIISFFQKKISAIEKMMAESMCMSEVASH